MPTFLGAVRKRNGVPSCLFNYDLLTRPCRLQSTGLVADFSIVSHYGRALLSGASS